MKPSLLRQVALIALSLMAGRTITHAADITWAGSSSDFDNATNWTGGVLPTGADNALLTNSGLSVLNVTANTTINSLVYVPGAASYQLNVLAGTGLTIGLGGIDNQSTARQSMTLVDMVAVNIVGSIYGPIDLINGPNSVLGITGTGAVTGDFTLTNSTNGVTGFDSGGSGTMHIGHAYLKNNGGEFVLGAGLRGDFATMNNDTGTLVVQNDADLSSMTVINNGLVTIQTISGASVSVGSLSGNGAVDITGKQIDLGATSADSTYAGIIGGSGGSLVKVGTGTLTLSGANTYDGGTFVYDGTLQANSTSLSGSVVDNATLVFNQTVDGIYGSPLSGSGALIKKGSGELTLLNSSGYSGTVDIAEGTLDVGSTISGDTVIDKNGTLMGSGSLNNVLNNGTLRPGIVGGTGTTLVTTYDGTGALEIPFNNAVHPWLMVSSTATLSNSTLRITGSQFTCSITPYTVITGGLINGTFASISAPPFLTYTTVYTPTNAKITLQSYDFQNAANSGNQQAIATALDTVASPMASGVGGSAANDTTPWGVAMEKLSQLTTAGAVHQAYEQLSGDALTSFYDVGMRQGQLFTESLTERAVPMDSAATSVAQAPVQLALNGDTRGLGTGAKLGKKPRGLWARALGAFSTTDADSSTGSPESTANTGGFEVGYDIAPNDALIVGAFAGYTRTGISVDDRNSTGSTNSFGLGAYGRYSPSAWFFDGSAAFIDNSNSMDRTLDFAGQTAHSSFSSPLLTVYGDAGYAFEPMADTAVEPYLALRISHLSQGGFTESDAPGEDLNVDQKSISSVVPTIAVRATHLFKPESKHPFMLGGTFGLDSELGTTDRTMTARFVDGTGPNFTVTGTPQKRIAADLSLGGRVAINQRWQGYGNYGFTVASEHFAQVIMGGARLTW